MSKSNHSLIQSFPHSPHTMKAEVSYKRILAISTPIMLGSAAQNVITLTDGIFLGRVGEVELAAIGFVGVFYLIIAAIGFGFSRGGQIMIARRDGEGDIEGVAKATYSLIYFELALSVIMFFLMYFGAYYFFSLSVNSDKIFYKSLEYLDYRMWGVFFSYIGVAVVAFYTGISRTGFILVVTVFLGIVNIILNYTLIFGKFGFPEMGIAGAGLASTIAEMAAFGLFLCYMFFDKNLRKYNLFKLPKVDLSIIKTQFRVSAPIVAQMVVSLGSWFMFFSIVENLGERELAASNVVRMVYLVLSIPCWGFSTGINTLVSNVIGQKRIDQVFPVINKTAWLCFLFTLTLTGLMLLFPDPIMSLFTPDVQVLATARPTLPILGLILLIFSAGSIYFNGLVGTGATQVSLYIQTVCAVFYLAYIYTVIEVLQGGLKLAWSAEILYWLVMSAISLWYLYSKRWIGVRV